MFDQLHLKGAEVMNWKKTFSTSIMIVILSFSSFSMTVSGGSANFSDISKKNSHYDAIVHLVESGSITGYDDGTFKPYENITRKHVAVILSRELDLVTPDNVKKTLSKYDDVDENHPYADEIAAVTKEEIFGGNSGKFMPEKSITREQLASSFYRGFELDQYEGNKEDTDQINLDNVDDDHKDSVKAFGNLKLTDQLKDFKPSTHLKRAQFASFLYNMMDFIENNDTSLVKKLDAVVESELPTGTVNGISVRNAETGKSLYSHFDKNQLRPASNMKLLTAAAALETLGSDHKFSTEMLMDGNISGSTLNGDLYLKGKGDPTLLKEDLDDFAVALKDKGVEEINGDIIGDDTWFDDVNLSEDMSWDNEPNYPGAPISALTMSPDDDYDTATVIVEVEPGSNTGDSAGISTVPETDSLNIINETETVASNKSQSISVERQHGTNDIVVQGNIPIDADASRSWSTVWDPTEYVIDVFKKSLKDEGIDIKEDAKIKSGKAPNDTELLSSVDSMSLEEILIPFMKLSNNGHAEILTKEMGRVKYGEGTWPNGLQVIDDVIDDLGLNTDQILLRDGSGMSDKTLIPAAEMSRLLYAVQDREWYSIYEDALPQAGESDRMVGGTLSNRLTNESTKGNVIAKTGSTTGVSTLSGYVTTQSGEKLTFSILNNNFDDVEMTRIQDQIATVLADHGLSDK